MNIAEFIASKELNTKLECLKLAVEIREGLDDAAAIIGIAQEFFDFVNDKHKPI